MERVVCDSVRVRRGWVSGLSARIQRTTHFGGRMHNDGVKGAGRIGTDTMQGFAFKMDMRRTGGMQAYLDRMLCEKYLGIYGLLWGPM